MFKPDLLPDFTIWECDTLADFIGELNAGEKVTFTPDDPSCGVVISSKHPAPIAYAMVQPDQSIKVYERVTNV